MGVSLSASFELSSCRICGSTSRVDVLLALEQVVDATSGSTRGFVNALGGLDESEDVAESLKYVKISFELKI